MNKLTKLAIIIASTVAATISAQASQYTLGSTVTLKETCVNPNLIVTIWSKTLGTQMVYAGITQLNITGIGTVNSFCIDPYQWSSSALQTYTVTDLQYAPTGTVPPPFVVPPMGSGNAALVNSLWADFYAQALADHTGVKAAELQIAIWETVAGSNFSLIGATDLATLNAGVAGMISYATEHPANANLVALSSLSYQDYVVQNVPDAGTTLVLLGLGLVAMAVVGRKARSVSTIS